MRLTTLLFAVAVMAGTAAQAAGTLTDPGKVRGMLEGATLHGTYLRTGSEYVLEFGTDGRLVKPDGDEGRWWVNDTGQYCREWLTGRLAGNTACLDLSIEGEGIAIHSNGRKVAEGQLSRN